MNDDSLRQAARDHRLLAAWEQAVKYETLRLRRALTEVPEELREVAASPGVVDLIACLLRIPLPKALGLMVRALQVQAATLEWAAPPVQFLNVRLSAAANLLDKGSDPVALARVARLAYAETRTFLRLPNVEVILEAYAAAPAARSKKPAARQSSSRSA